ncbi:hypothetical protein [Micromonospora wenchangensis]
MARRSARELAEGRAVLGDQAGTEDGPFLLGLARRVVDRRR